jgi:transcriptional regulator with PAS, ATPase and Fis domain
MTAFVTAESSVSAIEGSSKQRATASASTAPSLKEAERAYIQCVLKESTTLREAASKLGINTVTLWRKRKLYNI